MNPNPDHEYLIVGDDRVLAGISGGENGYLFLYFIDYVVEPGQVGSSEAFAWKIFDEDMILIGESGQGERPTDDAICGPVSVHISATDALGTLLAFLTAAAEAYGNDRSDNADLFSKAVMEWAYEMSDELQSFALDLGID